MSLPTTVDGVLSRMHDIEAALPSGDGAAVFNAMYLTVTERIGATIAKAGAVGAPTFHDPVAMADLDVRFANLWLEKRGGAWQVVHPSSAKSAMPRSISGVIAWRSPSTKAS